MWDRCDVAPTKGVHMGLRYDPRLDRMTGHDSLTGSYGHGFVRWEQDELELGARVALGLDEEQVDPAQWWWQLVGDRLLSQGSESNA